ncbi:MAG: riboflavin synthase [Deltaproteobacteria bacterium]|nr:riboflavin synthase [Deltaproteobacteria bacterium]
MFTGIIESTARIKGAESRTGSLLLAVEKPKAWKLRAGDSVSTDGVCLTVRQVGSKEYTTELMPETLTKTCFGKVLPRMVNLERAMKANDRFDGHIILGHVDTLGKLAGIRSNGRSKIIKMSFPKQFQTLVAKKGSVAVDGISLTITNVGPGWFEVSLVDYTITHTTLGKKIKGDFVNLEFDIIAKYLKNLINAKHK